MMTIPERIKWLECVKGFIEWEMPMDAVIAIEETIADLRKRDKGGEDGIMHMGKNKGKV